MSAYFFCHRFPDDQLCAGSVLNAESTDILTFAEHWGNYGVRQFLLAFVNSDKVVEADVPADANICQLDNATGKLASGCPGWYKLKLFVNLKHTCLGSSQPTTTTEESLLNDGWMHAFLGPVEETLSKRYTAVGVLEHWDKTMLLFNSALEMPMFDWPSSFVESKRRNTYKLHCDDVQRNDEAVALAKALSDPKLKQALWLDILLYDHAVSIFHRQMKQHGLS